MASPFPGMDPYLEQHWGDVHARLVLYGCDQLQQRLPPGLRARVEERVFVEASNGKDRQVVPDIHIFGRGKGRRPAAKSVGLATAEPLLVYLDEPTTETFIEVRDRQAGNRVVTVIEVLSLSNKLPGEGRDKYLEKCQELRNAQVSLVEVDLLRAGRRLLPVPLGRLPETHRTPYQIWARRGWQSITVEVYAVPLRERLPVIKVPLREKDADVPLDLQALIEQVYQNGGYDDIDYREEPDPPLDPADARWADALLRKKRLRPARRRRRR